jgi:hypothetical protein
MAGSLAIVVVSILTAAADEYSDPKVRAFRNVLAFGLLYCCCMVRRDHQNRGFLEGQKPNQTPMDSQTSIIVGSGGCGHAVLAGLMPGRPPNGLLAQKSLFAHGRSKTDRLDPRA